MVDSTLVSDTVAYHHWNGKVDKEWQRKKPSTRSSPCSFPTAAGISTWAARQEVNATIKAYLAR